MNPTVIVKEIPRIHTLTPAYHARGTWRFLPVMYTDFFRWFIGQYMFIVYLIIIVMDEFVPTKALHCVSFYKKYYVSI